MPMAAADIVALIKQGIPDAKVEMQDLAGDGDHWAATVVSAAFAGKSKIQPIQPLMEPPSNVELIKPKRKPRSGPAMRRRTPSQKRSRQRRPRPRSCAGPSQLIRRHSIQI